jgi:hypothetical protein
VEGVLGGEEKAFVPCSSASSFWYREDFGQLGYCHLRQATKLRFADQEFSVDMKMSEKPR